jgi:hypothetical protein
MRLDDRRAVLAVASVLVTATSAALLASAGWELGAREFPLDDAWIHQVYARSLLDDGSLAYNPGQPEAGFSSLLWIFTALPAQLASFVGVPIGLGAKLTSVVWAVLAAVGLGRVALALGGSRRAGVVTVAFAALSWGNAFAAVSAMEASLALACCAWGLALHLEGRPLAAGVGLAAACLARLECTVLTAVLGIDALATTVGRFRRFLSTVGPAVLACTLWVVVTGSITGHPLPNTFYVKSQHVVLAANARVFVRDVLLGEGVPHALLVAPLVAVALHARRIRGIWLVAIAAVCGTAGVALSRPLFPGVTFFQLRYFLPFTMLVTPVAALGLDVVTERLGNFWSRVVAGVGVLYLLAGAPSLAWSYRTHCHEVRVLHTQVAWDVAREAPREARVAVEAAGAMRYWGAHEVIDLYGLNRAEVAFARDNRARTCAIVRADASLVAVPPWWAPRLRPALELRPLRVYRVGESAVIAGAGAREVVLYAARPWPSARARCNPDAPSRTP